MPMSAGGTIAVLASLPGSIAPVSILCFVAAFGATIAGAVWGLEYR